jgi:tetratricopeptide (TPR) repeat protein
MKLKKIYLIIFLFAALFTFSQSTKKIVKQAKKDFKAQKYQAAIDGYTQALKLKPNNFNYTTARALAFEKFAKPQEAIADYITAIKLKPKINRLYMKVADLSIGMENYTLSVQYLDALIAMDKKNIEALQKASFSYLKLKNFSVALDKANQALDVQRYNYVNHYYKALALDSLKDYTNANIDYVSAIRLMKNEEPNDVKPLPKFKPYYANHALVLYRLNDNDNAIKEYDIATSIDAADSVEPKHYYINYLESQPFLKKTDFTNAVGYLNKSMALNPKFTDGFFARAQIYKQTSQFQSAISDYTKVIQLENNNVNAYYGRGQSYLELGNYPEAITDLKQAAQLQPNNFQIKNLLKEASDKNYQLNKESDAPTLVINYPVIDNSGFANIVDNQLNILVEGQVNDKSLINEIRLTTNE